MSNGDFKLRHWRSPAYIRLKEPEIDIPPEANSESEISNWSPNAKIREEYTSIRDLIVSSPRSCVGSPTYIGSEIQIRNPLVKQAVYTYLQLTPSSADSASSSARDLSLRRILAAVTAAFHRCFGIIARLLCCASSGDLR